MPRRRKYPFIPNQLVVYVRPKYLDGSGFLDPIPAGALVLFLGEIKQMPGHCSVVTRDQKVHWPLHITDFREPTDDEV